MLKHTLTAILVTAAIFAGAAGTALASLSQPDVVYVGTALTATATSIITITPAGATTPLASCTVAQVGTHLTYLLRVPMDDVGTRLAGTARMGDTANISIDGVQTASVVIPKFGTVVSLELGVRSKAQWDKDHPGDTGSGDMNHNGISDLTEYLSGKDPASCVWSQGSDAAHAETTIYNSKVLVNCLNDAGSDGKHNLIRLAQGAYPGNYSYAAGWGESFDLTLTGGYDPAGTLLLPGTRTINPALTILNGDTDADQIGNGIVFVIDTDSSKTTGKVHIESLTFKNGKASKGQNGGAIQAVIYKGDLELVGNIFTSNSADSGGAVSAESRGSALIFLVNNLLYANSANNASAALTNAAAGGAVVLLNNTIAENAANVNGDGRSLVLKTSIASTVDITNNIIAGFASVTGTDVYVSNSDSSSPIIRNNSLDTADLLVNTSGYSAATSNAVCDPQFVSLANANYRLGAASNCINAGFIHAKLPAKDSIGAARISGMLVDLGAYENQLQATYTVTGSVLLGSGTIICSSPVQAGAPSTCTLSPVIGWYIAALTDNGSDVVADVASNKYAIPTVTQNHDVKVTFQEYLVRRISAGITNYHTDIPDALSHALNNDRILLLDMAYPAVSFSRPVSITIVGGYASGFGSVTGTTVLHSKTAITSGKVIMKNIDIR